MEHYSFIETIKVKNGQFYNLPAHLDRMRNTISHFCGKVYPINILNETIPEDLCNSLVKCRILYNLQSIVSIDFIPYDFKKIDSLTIVECDDISYEYKFANRSQLDHLYQQRKQASDIIIVKDGCITDASYANLVFENEDGFFTPKTYLLNGTKRQLLISQGKIKEEKITVSDIQNYDKVYLINAMIDLEDHISIPIADIRF